MVENNPFVHETATNLSNDIIKKIFIDNAESNMIQNQKNVIITGYRGSGKSMLLKYHSLPIQFTNNHELNLIGVYIPCNTPLFSKVEHFLIDNKFHSQIVGEHILTLSIADKIIQTLLDTDKRILNIDDLEILKNELKYYFDISNESSDILAEIKSQIKSKLYSTQKMLNQNPDEFYKTSESFSSFVIPLIEGIKSTKSFKNSHFMIMLDDAQLLTKSQQTSLNTLISFRDTSSISFKIAIASLDEYSLETNTSSVILENHDYISVDLVKSQFTEKSNYLEFAKKIIKKRLDEFSIQSKSVEDFFPVAPKFKNDIDVIREKFIRGDYDELKEKTAEERKKQLSKYDRAIYFRLNHSTQKANHSKLAYTGFKVISHLSTGVIRNLLIPCYKMYEKQVERDGNNNFKSIDYDIQYDSIKEISEDKWENEVNRVSRFLKNCSEYDQEMLSNFLINFSNKLRERLLDPTSREKQMLSFTITDLKLSKHKKDLNRIINHGILAGLIYTRIGPDKSGGKTIWYTPNRLLWPHYGLDPVGQNGRMNILSEEVFSMMKNPKHKSAYGNNDNQEELFYE